MSNHSHETPILIIDFGSQTTQLIARRVRELGVYCEISPYTISEEQIKAFNPRGVIFSGGPETVTVDHTPRAPQALFDLGIPVLGICYGMQTICEQMGGKVDTADKAEFGHTSIHFDQNSDIFKAIIGGTEMSVWMSHGDHVVKMPEGFECIAKTDNAEFAAIENKEKQIYALQFHPEITHSEYGKELISNFLLKVCDCHQEWKTAAILEDIIDDCRQKVGKDHVILGLSGGLDSSVVAGLLQKAIGHQLTCIFVDTGLLRLNEAEQVQTIFNDRMGGNFIHIDAKSKFLNALKGISDPEDKRKIIGKLFVEVFEEEAKKAGDKFQWLAQGTIYPDVIESAGDEQVSKTIKSHHNVGGLPEKMHLKLLEPLRELFKDEVKQIGQELNIPDEIIFRHPFPGPGLAVRYLGAICEEELMKLKKADAIFIEELKKADLYLKVSQAFCVFIPMNTVGVQGDARIYEPVISLRCVTTTDFMSAKSSDLPFSLLQRTAHRIINEVKGISRVLYDITDKPPATIEWE